MNDSCNISPPRVSIEQVIADFLNDTDADNAPDRNELIARFPAYAAELQQFFADDDRLGDLALPFLAPQAAVPDNATPYGEPPTIPPPLPRSSEFAGELNDRFGDYELIEEIARGGMGVVYKARQVSLNRIVAIKMILAGQLANQQDVLRFRAEAEAAAGLQHPNIVAIHEVGECNGQHYFSMDFVAGSSLASVVREQPLPARQAAQLVRTIAEAVHYAHQRGILHRDLKPSNILLQIEGSGIGVQGSVTEGDGKRTEGSKGRWPSERSAGDLTSSDLNPEPRTLNPLIPKITDFGLAKRIASGSDLTGTGQILGTPSYMPPEQAAARHGEIGPASDVYALGAILYEVVTGRPPFRAETSLDTLVQVLEVEPVAPRLLNRSVPRDLETIAMKCLQKDQRRRYPTAQQLADDLQRFSDGEPIVARAVGSRERLVRWCLRRPGWALMIAVSFLAVLLITGGSVWFSGRLRQQLNRTSEKQSELQLALARQVAERLDSDLRQLAGVPRTLAAVLSERSDWTELQIDECLRHMLAADRRLFGMCVAFERNGFEIGTEDFARYIYRAEAGPTFKYLHPPQYPPYRDRDWYRLPVRERRGMWSEPYVDRGGGDVPMVTYSEPIQRGDRCVGVVTADLSLAYFRQLKSWLDELQLARGDYGFVISSAGTFISDANPDYQMGRRLSEFARPDNDPSYTILLDLVQRNQPGSVKGLDFWTGNSVTYLVAPVPSSGWSFVAVVPDQSFLLNPSAAPR